MASYSSVEVRLTDTYMSELLVSETSPFHVRISSLFQLALMGQAFCESAYTGDKHQGTSAISIDQTTILGQGGTDHVWCMHCATVKVYVHRCSETSVVLVYVHYRGKDEGEC